MHEMPVVLNVVDVIDGFAEQNGIDEVRKVVMDIGLVSSVVPFFFASCWDAAVGHSRHLLNAELEINEIPAVCRCLECGAQFDVTEKKPVRCPKCGGRAYKAYSGADIEIREILVDDVPAPA